MSAAARHNFIFVSIIVQWAKQRHILAPCRTVINSVILNSFIKMRYVSYHNKKKKYIRISVSLLSNFHSFHCYIWHAVLSISFMSLVSADFIVMDHHNCISLHNFLVEFGIQCLRLRFTYVWSRRWIHCPLLCFSIKQYQLKTVIRPTMVQLIWNGREIWNLDESAYTTHTSLSGEMCLTKKPDDNDWCDKTTTSNYKLII